MVLKDVWPVVGAPVAAIIVGLYHKYSISPRLARVECRMKDVEDKSDDFTAGISELRTDVKWIRTFMENGHKK